MSEIITSKKEALKKLEFCLDLSLCSEQLQDDKDVVLLAVEKNPFCLQHASPRLRSDSDIVCEAARQDYGSLIYANRDILCDKPTMLKILSYASMALEYAGDNIKDDKEAIETAIEHKGLSLKYASKKLKEDKSLVLKALANTYFVTSYLRDLIPLSLKNDKDLYHCIVDSNQRINLVGVKIFNPDICDDIDIVMKAVSKDVENMRCASDRIKRDKTLMLPLIKNDEHIFEYIGDNLNDDEEVALEALSMNKSNLRFVSKRLYALLRDEKDPVNYLKTFVFNKKLEEDLMSKNSNSNRFKL